ncbi:fungal specific transcription factor domain-containing protein [Aspergillus mulundensis]|uniref:Xylanolytic transcriptional activator regulatory domain-containing protein n=1 Tax=Aspergillus mulundensis TaxID=1810919 RepID=A0A3D8S5B0_9EURO|nr:hypothetical protein DSM5745_04848 [Aspergillus mulundensis]RDW81291.1 hypothetical protein DSM5745_04848 [Aspergillus mulundensis]
MKDRAWFQSHNDIASALPIFVSEVACTAFATRLCQWLSDDTPTSPPHIPRMQYTNEATLDLLAQAETPWPSLPRARLLVQTALGHASPLFHLTVRKRTVDYLDTIYRTGAAAFGDPVLVCKYFALFALGEVCSVVRSAGSGSGSDSAVPVSGTAYYARAVSLIPLLPERPSMAHIEALVILSLTSQFLNRWHSAYTILGIALRLGLSVGLNHNIPPEQCADPIARENRVRVWWTIYNFDRFWGMKLGLPVQVDDCDIRVDLPSDPSPGPNTNSGSGSGADVARHHEEFVDCSYQVALIELARIASKIMRRIYSRAVFAESFLLREQGILSDLRQWLKGLPEHLQLRSQTETTGLGNGNVHIAKPTVSIHLQFNYCVILATRPILLSMLDHLTPTSASTSTSRTQNPQPTAVPPALTTLAEACIHSARRTISLCSEEWIQGSLPVYGYAFAQYIFTAALVLVVSSVLPAGIGIGIGIPEDAESIKTASEILGCLVDGGCLVAHDLAVHLERVQACLGEWRARSRSGPLHRENAQYPNVMMQPPCQASAGAGEAAGCPIPDLSFTTNTRMRDPSLDLPHSAVMDTDPGLLDAHDSPGFEFQGAFSADFDFDFNPFPTFPLPIWDSSDI